MLNKTPDLMSKETSVLPRMIRADGQLRASFSGNAERTQIDTLYEQGGYRLKFPKSGACEAVSVNTGGGMAGGDRLAIDLTLRPQSALTFTTQSAEKIYRAEAQASEVRVSARLEAGSHLAWLPQETLLFSGAKLHRRFEVDLAQDAGLDLIECVIFGRGAMGEAITSGEFEDRWRIKRDGRLIYADNIKLEGDMAAELDRAAIGKGARAIATFLCISPAAESKLDAARAALSLSSCECGASAWNGMLIVRFAASDPALLRRSVTNFLEAFRAVPMPRVWQC